MDRIRVTDNGRFLAREDGSPFFYLGDTAWELFHRLSLPEAETYLTTRAEQKFSVVQAVALAELDGLTVPNANGDLPLIDLDPARPNEAYFHHIDEVVTLANRLGLVVGFLPTWGDKVNRLWGVGPEIFSPETAHRFGRWIGSRYRDVDLIWILGGDRPIEGDAHRNIWRAMATGLREGDGGNHLIAFHPMGGGHSSQWLHREEWLDFNMIQSGHGGKAIANYRMIADDYALEPAKPCMDAEPCYENHPVGWDPEHLGWFDDFDVRRAAYWAVFAGAHGHTYGCNDVWQMADRWREPVGYARNAWHEVLALPGASHMRYLRALMESRPYFTRVPDQGLLVDPVGDSDHPQATRCSEGAYAFVYLPRGGQIAVDLQVLGHLEVDASWFSPRTGHFETFGRFPANRPHLFEAPSTLDWVLVLDDPNASHAPPQA